MICRGPFYWHGLNLIPEWISNHIPCRVCDKIIGSLPNFNCASKLMKKASALLGKKFGFRSKMSPRSNPIQYMITYTTVSFIYILCSYIGLGVVGESDSGNRYKVQRTSVYQWFINKIYIVQMNLDPWGHFSIIGELIISPRWFR